MKRIGLPALSLWNPHAALMAIGAKAVETRATRFAVTGPLAIASTVAVPANHRAWAQNLCYRDPFKRALEPHGWGHLDSMPRGCIVALVWVLGEVTIGPLVRETVRATYGRDEMEFGFYDDGRVAMTTDRARLIRLPQPVHVKGKQGKWFVDRDTRAAIRAQIDTTPMFLEHYRDAFDDANDAEFSPPAPMRI